MVELYLVLVLVGSVKNVEKTLLQTEYGSNTVEKLTKTEIKNMLEKEKILEQNY